MCGIFGAVACGDPQHFDQVIDVLLALGAESEERGKDSAGIAMLTADTEKRDFTPPTADDVRKDGCAIDGAYIVKATTKFSSIDFEAHRPTMEQADIFLGHTRWATQGATDDYANASPMLVGALIGTHNGDVNVKSVPKNRLLAKYAHGSTDSEILYLALHATRKDRRNMTSILKAVRGRAALAFVDRTRPDRLYIARTALSPVCFTYDQYGNFYYASNPDWFRRIAKENPTVEFDDITLVPEGYLLTINTLTGDIEDQRRFTPTCRESDSRMANLAAYRGFTDDDRAADVALQRHHVEQPSLGAWRELTSVPVEVPEPVAPAVAASGNAVQRAQQAVAQSRAVQTATDSGLGAWRFGGPDAEQVEHSSMDDRIAAEEPEVWSDEYADDAWSGYEVVGNDALNNDYDAINDPTINWDQVEHWCWYGGDFDHRTYEDLMDAATPEEAYLILNALKDRVESGALTV